MAKRMGPPMGNLNRKGGNARFITEAIILELKSECTDPNDPKSKIKQTRVKWMVAQLVKLAMQGDAACLKLVMHQVEGTPTQTVQFKESTPENEEQMLDFTRAELEKMTPERRNALYLSALRETQGVGGSA